MANSHKEYCRKLLGDIVGDSHEALHVTFDDDSKRKHTFSAFFLANAESVVRAASYTPRSYAVYGGHHYFRPDGWIQFYVDPWCLTTPWMEGAKQLIEFGEIDDWPIAYHGTSCDKLLPILSKGLRRPGELPEVVVEHGQCGADGDGAIYMTPSLWYASHPVYSPLKELGSERWAQAVLKLRVRPDSFKIQGNTLGDAHWPRELLLDPNYSDNNTIEWLVQGSTMIRCDVVIVGIMIRELGHFAQSAVFGYCPPLLGGSMCSREFQGGPEYRWTSFLINRFRKGGFLSGQVPERPVVHDQAIDPGSGALFMVCMAQDASQSPEDMDVPNALTYEKSMTLDGHAALAWQQHALLQRELIKSFVRGEPLRKDPDHPLRYSSILADIWANTQPWADLSEASLLEWHARLMGGLIKSAGHFRTKQARCGARYFLPSKIVPEAMARYIEISNSVLRSPDISCFAKAGWIVNHFIQIHPFQDGNGRMSRLLTVWVLQRAGFLWSHAALFRSTAASRRAYVSAMATGETKAIATHIFQCCLESMVLAANPRAVQIGDGGNLELIDSDTNTAANFETGATGDDTSNTDNITNTGITQTTTVGNTDSTSDSHTTTGTDNTSDTATASDTGSTSDAA